MNVRISHTINLVVCALIFPLIGNAQPSLPNVSWALVPSEDDDFIVVERGVTDVDVTSFRGTGVVEANIGRVVSVFSDRERAKEWEFKLADARVLQRNNLQQVVWQRTKSSFLGALFGGPRDRYFIVVSEVLRVDEERKYIHGRLRDFSSYTDIELTESQESMIPTPRRSIRGTLLYSDWQLRPTGPESTCVRIEVLLRVNGNGDLNAEQLRDFEETWPYSTIQGLRRQVRKNDIERNAEFGDWAADTPDAMIDIKDCLQGNLYRDEE